MNLSKFTPYMFEPVEPNAVRYINGKDVHCLCSEFDWRSMKMQLAPLNQEATPDVTCNASRCHLKIDDMPLLRFIWNEKIYCAKSSSTPGDYSHSIPIALYKLQCEDDLHCGDRILFYIPHYPKAKWAASTHWVGASTQFWQKQPDLTQFEALGRKWTIRRALLDPDCDFPKPYDLYTYPADDSNLCGCFLETQVQDGDGCQELSDMAESLCRLEGLSIGRFIMWQTAWVARYNEYFLYKESNIGTTESNFTGVHAVAGSPGFYPACILPSTIDNYLTDKNIWATILYWFLAAMYNASLVRVSLHLQFPLIERIVDSAFLALTEGFTGQNFDSEDFKETLKASRRALKAELKNTSIPPEASATEGLLRLWSENIDNGPYYKRKISSLFQYAGYSFTEEELKELEERNALAHSAYIHTKDCLEAYNLFISITQKTYMIILGMLGYGGSFEVMGEVLAIDQVLPRHNEISLPSLRNTGRHCRIASEK